mmetsp:Transcript_2008/g.4352  ORF Transcript_2008/g.4352 Transcript_2008/m.4352 type:complete len:455 (+) Transcript_2008:218-1582(+)
MQITSSPLPMLRRTPLPSLVLALSKAVHVSLFLLVLQHTQQQQQQRNHATAFQRDHHQRFRYRSLELDGSLPLRKTGDGLSSISRCLLSTKTKLAPSSLQRKARTQVVAISMLPTLPPSYEYDDSVVFFQRATGTRIQGRKELECSIQRWDTDFKEEVDGEIIRNINSNDDNNNDIKWQPRFETSSATTTSPTTLLVRWNLTYVDPSIQWMVALVDAVPGWTADFSTYNDKVSEERRFSYSALGKLFARALSTGKLRVPLACIEGVSTCEFVQDGVGNKNKCENGNENENKLGSNSSKRRIRSIAEDLAYAQDLNRGAMANRVCARDLQFFLEIARKPPEFYHETNGVNTKTNNNNNDGASSANGNNQDELYWEDRVTYLLPWRSVPGMMDPMYIEAQAEEDIAANLPLLFGAFSFGLLLVFGNWIAPNLIGQSLFGGATYIVPPSELNEIIGY